MTEEDTITQIAQCLAVRFVYGRDNEFNPLNYEGLSQNEKEDCQRDAARLFNVVEQAGYVKLSEDQSLPSFRNAVNKSYNDYMLGQEDMRKANFKRVE